jgi:hypothetical protein
MNHNNLPTLTSSKEEVLNFIKDNNIYFHIHNNEDWDSMSASDRKYFLEDILWCINDEDLENIEEY